MKILKIFGVVVGVHVFALILIFANPGCSSAKRPTRDASETVIASGGDTSAMVAPAPATNESPVSLAPPPSFDPNAPAAPVVRFTPTRPGTPTAAALEAAPVADVTPATTYTVVRGDSLWTIAKKHHSSVGEIAAANNLRSSATVRVGQKLIIPAKSVAASAQLQPAESAPVVAATLAAPRASGEAVKHIVRPGETLGAIARKYQVKVGDIATANAISDPARIRPGMELTIPGWQAPTSRTSRATPSTTTSRPATQEPTAMPATQPATTESVPTIVIPAPEQDLDAGLRDKQGDAPVIPVEEK